MNWPAIDAVCEVALIAGMAGVVAYYLAGLLCRIVEQEEK